MRLPILLWLVLVAATPTAALANPYLDEGRQLYGSLRFRDAIVRLEIARKVQASPLAEHLEVLELLGRALLAEGRLKEAEGAFAEMVTLDPSVALPNDSPPRLLETFRAAKRTVYPEGFIGLRALLAPPGSVRLELKDPWARAARLLLRHRARANAPWSSEALPIGSPIVARALSDGLVEQQWEAELVDAEGTALVTARGKTSVSANELPMASPGPGAPASTAVQPRKLAAWIAGGVSILLAGTAIYFAQSAVQLSRAATDSSTPPGDWADTARAARGRANDQLSAALGLGIGAGAGLASAGVLFSW